MPRKDFLHKLEGCAALFCTPHDIVDKEALDNNRGALQVIATVSVGYNHLHLDEIKKRGIRIGFVGDTRSSEAVAEFNVGLAIATSRQFQQSRSFITSGDWFSKQTSSLSTNIRGLGSSVVGIVGLGKIGLATAKILRAFQVSRVLYTSRVEKEEGKELDAEFVSLDTLCKESDFIFVTCALTNETEGLIGRNQFGLMRSSAILINTSRGRVLDQDALIETLRQNKIAGAGLDVMIPEPLPGDHPLCKLDNCIITSHISSCTKLVREMMSYVTAENIIRGYKGEPMLFEL